MIVLETALPAKFGATIARRSAASRRGRPRFAGIEALPRRFVTMPADAARVKALIAENG